MREPCPSAAQGSKHGVPPPAEAQCSAMPDVGFVSSGALMGWMWAWGNGSDGRPSMDVMWVRWPGRNARPCRMRRASHLLPRCAEAL